MQHIFIGKTRMRSFVITGLIALFLILPFHNENVYAKSHKNPPQTEKLSSTFRDAAKSVSPAVVYISTVYTVKGIPDQLQKFFGEEFFRRFFGGTPEKQERQRRGLGSGFIVNQEGYILTNSHVVEKADEINVMLPDKREFTAEVIGTDPKSDVAVIKIDAEKTLPVVELGDSETAEVGDWVLAVGNPYGLSETVTAGIVSAEGRANIGIVDYEDFIQTDAAINPGNSGGPLVNSRGEVIGLNTAIFSRSGGYQGIGFAIPINMARDVMDSLIAHGRVIRGWLGVVIQPVTEKIAQSFGLKEAKGTLIGDVLKESPAEKAGLQRGDVIISFDGKAIETPNELKNIVARTEVDKTVPVKLIRDGEQKTLKVTVGEQEPEKMAQKEKEKESPSARFGLHVQELTPQIAQQLGYTKAKGVVISQVDPGSPADEAGLQRGDLIQEVDRQKVTSVSEYRNQLSSIKKDESFLLLVRRGKNTLYVVVNAEKEQP